MTKRLDCRTLHQIKRTIKIWCPEKCSCELQVGY